MTFILIRPLDWARRGYPSRFSPRRRGGRELGGNRIVSRGLWLRAFCFAGLGYLAVLSLANELLVHLLGDGTLLVLAILALANELLDTLFPVAHILLAVASFANNLLVALLAMALAEGTFFFNTLNQLVPVLIVGLFGVADILLANNTEVRAVLALLALE